MLTIRNYVSYIFLNVATARLPINRDKFCRYRYTACSIGLPRTNGQRPTGDRSALPLGLPRNQPKIIRNSFSPFNERLLV